VDSRRVVIFIVLSIAVFVGWSYFFPPPVRRPVPHAMAGSDAGAPADAQAPDGAAGAPPGAGSPAAAGAGSGSGQAGVAAASAGAGAGSTAAAAGGAGSAAAAAGTAAAVPAGPPIGADHEETVVLMGKGVRAIFTNRGAQLKSVVVDEADTATVRGGPMQTTELIRNRAEGPYPFALVDRRLRPLPVESELYAVERGADGRSVEFRYSGKAGSAEKSFRFDDRGLLAVSAKAGGTGWDVSLGPGIGNPTAAEIGNRYGQRDAVVRMAGDVEVLNPKGEEEVKTFPGRTLDWVGLEDTFFAMIAVPRGGSVARAVLQPVLVEPAPEGTRFEVVPPKDDLTKAQKELNREYALLLEPAAGSVAVECFVGEKRYETLKALPYSLAETVRLGSLGWVVRPLLAGLHWIYDHVVPNYGWAIILMTLAIKVVLLPLTHQSTMSMRKMQVLNPRMQSIRDRYRAKLKDKQGRPNLESQRKMNEEIMALYKSEGVNPAGGCVPLLAQMPILWAFYRLLSTSVELRHAPWVFWVHDLSAQDPYFILPLIMGATQFLQVLLAPQSGDPSQRRLFLVMPLFMMIFFFAAPSGLVLYWLTNNVLTIIQQAVYNRFWKLEGAK
jgi:YidC/Oxa1 family membrane protein insertase